MSEPARLKSLQLELRAMAERIAAIADELDLCPETVAKLPKTYRSRGNWSGFGKAPTTAQRVSVAVSALASDIDMGVSLAEAAEIK